MLKRVLAAAVALALAAIGIYLVISYAQRADERALQGMETERVLVAVETVPAGTPSEEIGERVELQEVPRAFVARGGLSALAEVSEQVLVAPLAVGEQLTTSRFQTPQQVREAGAFDLPDEAESMHQVTISLDRTRAVGGNLTAGDTVGVFLSFEVDGSSGYVLGPDGVVAPASTEEEGDSTDGSGQVSTTHLTFHKVLVVDVEGSTVRQANDEDDQGQTSSSGPDSVAVTLALEAPDAERLVYGMEFGTVWLSLEPEDASEDGTEVVVVTVPDRARNVYE